MKRIITLFTLLLLVFSVEIFAQSPTYFNYQAVIRDNSGGLLVDRLVHVKIAIREGNVSGPIAYQEVHSVTTNTFGLVNLVVGAGAPLQGTMPTVDWGANPHFIDIELDANNTGVYTQMGTTQILSVPYALHARTVQFNDDADADPTNEIQTFVLQNNELYLDNNGNGGFMVNLNPYLDNTDNQVLSVFDSTTTIRNMLISGGNKVTFSIADNDNDSINEIQQVSILNDTIYLSRGGFIDLKPYLDNTDEQTLNLVNDTLVISGSNDTISLSDYRQKISLLNDTITLSGTSDTLNLVPYLDNTDEQTLTLANDTLVISGSNDTISLSDYRQRLTLQNDTLTLSGSMDTLNLVPYLDNTDEQTLTLTNDTLVISGSNDTISLTSYLDNTDEQTLMLANDTLVISGSNDTISLVPYKQVLSVSNDTIFLTDGGFIELPSPAGIPDLERVGDSINVQGSFTRVSVNDNDADSTNELQILTFSNDTLILSETQDTIDFSGYSLRIDTNAADIASLYIELDNDSTFLNDLIDSNLVLIGANQTLATGASNLANQNAIDIADLNAELDEDSTNFDTLISNLQSTQQMSDSMLYAKIASDSTNFDTLVAANATDISNLEIRVTNDSTNFDTLITANSNAIMALGMELDADSTNFDTLISDLASAQQMADSMLFAKIASDSTNFDTLVAANATDISNLEIRVTNDSTNFDTLIAANSNSIMSLGMELDADSTNFDTLISDLASAQQMADSMLYAKIASDSTNFDTLVAANATDISNLEIRVTNDSTNFDTLIAANSNSIMSLGMELDADSTNFDTLISDLASAQQMADSMLFAKIASDSTNFDTLVAANATDISNLEIRVTNDSANFDTLITNLRSDLSDTSSTLRGLISAASTQALSDLSDTASALRMYTNMVSSQDSGVVHGALNDTASDIRTDYSARFAQLTSDLTDSSSALRSTIIDSTDAIKSILAQTNTKKVNLTAIVDPVSTDDLSFDYEAGSYWLNAATGKMFVCVQSTFLSAIWVEVTNTDVQSALEDSTIALKAYGRNVSSSDSSTVHNALTDTAGDLRTGISASLAQANSNLSDTSTVLRGMIKVASSSDSSVVHNALLDSASAIRGAIPAASTDDQNLTLNAGRTLSIESGNTVDLRVLSDSSISALGDTASAIRTSLNNLDVKQSNFTAIVDPVTTNDLSEGYEAGSYWLNAATGKMFVCVASGLISATWVEVTNPTVQSALEDSASAIRSSISAASTDDQNLTLNAGKTLSIEGGNTVDLRVLSDSAISALADSASAIRGAIPSASTDDQNLTLNAGKTLSIEGGNTVDLRVLSDSAISALNDSSQAIRNTINTVIEYVSLNCIYDSSTVGSDLPNSFYFPFSGVHALENLQNISSSMIMPYDGEVISATVRTDQNLPFNLLKFYKNGVYSNSNIGSGLSAGVFNKSNFSGTTAQKSFSRGDLIQFRFETIAASSSQKIYILIELSYDR